MHKQIHKQIIEYTSPLDALVALAKQLSIYETQYHLKSEAFFTQYSQGETSDDEIFIEWANNYQHYLDLQHKLKYPIDHERDSV
jgi:hypothetical protein